MGRHVRPKRTGDAGVVVAVTLLVCLAAVPLGARWWSATHRDRDVGGVEVTATDKGVDAVAAGFPRPPKPKAKPKPKPTVEILHDSHLAADANGASIPLFAGPGGPPAAVPSLANPTHEGLKVVFLVRARQPGWYQVQVSHRPNEWTAWVRASDVTVREVPHVVQVDVSDRHLWVKDRAGTVLFETPVAVGKAATPTPTGRFFVDGIVPLAGGTAYGRGQSSVAGFSNELMSFGGGVGQIAMHGTNRPQLMGQAVSNGCIRMPDPAILRVMELAPTGTPVDVVP